MRPKNRAPAAQQAPSPLVRWVELVSHTKDGDHVELARRLGDMPARFQYLTVLDRRAWLTSRSAAMVRNFDFDEWDAFLAERRAQAEQRTGCRGCDIECLVQTWLSRQECAYRRPAARA